MMDFLDKKIKNSKKIGTPTKKRKLNQNTNSLTNQFNDFQFPANLIFIRNISNNQNNNLFQNQFKQKSNFHVNQFAMDQEASSFEQNKQNNINNYNLISEDQQQLKIPSKITKKQTLIQKNNSHQYDHILAQLSLTRNNSTFPITNFLDFQNQQAGQQNIYLTQLLTLKSKISLTQVNNKNRQLLRNTKQNNNQDYQNTQNRLQKDYEIKQNLGKFNNSNKQGYICLNKLQKIFYFVKKIKLLQSSDSLSQNRLNSLSQQCQDIHGFLNSLNKLSKSKKQITNEQIIQQVTDQIKLYNKDTQGHLVRYYQEWIQNNNIFIIYQLGSYSLADKNITNKKLPQNQIWSILYDVTSTLKWIYDNQKVHLNIKPGNILKCRSKYKLTDPYVNLERFQKELLSKIQNSCQNPNSSFYLAPQLIQFKGYLEGIQFSKCEVYSLGLCILQNITVIPANIKNKSMNEVKKYFKKQIHGYSSCLKKILLRMIQKNFKKRPTLEELLSRNLDDIQNSNNKIKNQQKFKRSNSI